MIRGRLKLYLKPKLKLELKLKSAKTFFLILYTFRNDLQLVDTPCLKSAVAS